VYQEYSLAYFYGAMVPSNLALEMSASVMLMVIIGGPGTLFGPFIGCSHRVLIEHFASIYVPERWPFDTGWDIYCLCDACTRWICKISLSLSGGVCVFSARRRRQIQLILEVKLWKY